VNFEIPADIAALQARTRGFIAEHIIPLENDPRLGAHGPDESLRAELLQRARAAGLLAPHVSKEMGGLGLDHRGRAVVFEEAGYSTLGPVAMNLFAPDEGNMHLLEVVANAQQRERFLRPLAAGDVRSCFCMTEPAPGAGADPSMLQTTARREGGSYVIDGTKWLITGAEGAAFAIIMARMEDGTATMFLSPMDAAGIRIERTMSALDRCFPGGHAVVSFAGLRVGEDAVLGEVGKGFRYAQVRLAPARLTHCMRWLGAARRAQDEALAYARERQAFGKRLGDHEGVGFMLADNAMDMHITRLAIWHAAWVLDQGESCNVESSMTKVLSSEAIFRVVDRCVQILGGQGVTSERVVERIFRDVRPFRIYDGPSEVHRYSLAKKLLGPVTLAR
jgi:acyl-CoA dehydrogenase